MPLRADARTRSGLALDEVASALQKCCRRALEVEAIYFAEELLKSGYGRYCWKRLLCVASEDVGLGDHDAVALVHSLHDAARAYIDKRTPTGDDWVRAEIFLVHAVMVVCRAAKSRFLADISLVMDRRYRSGERIEVPEFALDMHTARGRELGRTWMKREGIRFWQEQSRVLRNEVVLDDGRWQDEFDRFLEADVRAAEPDGHDDA